jgi:hypothetical protein
MFHNIHLSIVFIISHSFCFYFKSKWLNAIDIVTICDHGSMSSLTSDTSVTDLKRIDQIYITFFYYLCPAGGAIEPKIIFNPA